MKDIIIAPSLLAANFLNLEKEITRLEEAKIKWLHYDVMDGHFVPAISFGSEILKQISNFTDLFLDVHIMATNPEHCAKLLIDAGANNITFHYEATGDVIETINKLREISADIMIGMSIKPLTPVDEILEYLPYLDMILVMSVEPGKGGQKFNIEALDKIEQLRRYIDENSFECLIEVDGGINGETGKDCALAGADVLVSGTYLFRSENIEKSIEKIKNID